MWQIKDWSGIPALLCQLARRAAIDLPPTLPGKLGIRHGALTSS